MHVELQNAASVAEFDKIMNIKNEMELLVEKYPNLKSIDLDTIQIINQEGESLILPEYPPIFKIKSLKVIEQGTVHLEVDPRNIPTTTCRDGCAVNMKGARLLTETHGINSPSSNCSSHLASGTIRRMCTSANSSQADATSLYDNLKALLKHFAMSPKSTEFLNNALNALELNSVHMLNWGSTCMAGFMDACVQASEILIPFLDTLVAGNIRPDETKFIASPKGVYLIQLFADLQCIFTDSYLHRVDSDSVLICETYNVAQKTVQTLLNEELKTPNADALLEGLHSDRNQNIMADIKMKDAVHTVMLNSKVTRGVTLDKVKEKLVKSKMEILQCMADNFVLKWQQW